MSLAALTGDAWSVAHPDFASVVALDRDHMAAAWTEQQWSALSASQRVHLWHRPELQGFALYQLEPLDRFAHLLKIVVAPAQRGVTSGEFWQAQLADLRGLGIDRIFLEVAVTNSAAIRFYEKCGFRLLRRVKGFYKDGTDALTMELIF